MFCIISPVFEDGAFIFKCFIINSQFTFNKQEKLKSRKRIDHDLFSNGKSASAFPITVLFDFAENAAEPLQAGVTVSSRKFKKAVERNRVKRILREGYRLQKFPLEQYLKRKWFFPYNFFYLYRERTAGFCRGL